MKHILILTLALMVNSVYGQIEAVTSRGDVVILNPDSTWHYKPIAKDTAPVEGCDRLIVKKFDEVSGNTYIGTGKSIVISQDNKTGFWISVSVYKENVNIVIKIQGLSDCIEDDAKIYILFKDGTRFEMRNASPYNCKGKFSLFFEARRDKSNFMDLWMKEVSVMRIVSDGKMIERKFTSQNAIDFKKSVECVNATAAVSVKNR